jgi:hypothetical protein
MHAYIYIYIYIIFSIHDVGKVRVSAVTSFGVLC